MQLTLNTAALPAGDLSTVPSRAKSLGFEAIEVALPQPLAADPADGSIVADRELVSLVMTQADMVLAGLAAPIAFRADADPQVADAVRRVIDLAARLRCPRVRVYDMPIPPGLSREAAAIRFADQLLPLADHAAEAGVRLLVQNTFGFRRAEDLWRLMEQASHPALACAWDPLASIAAGDDPMVAVPTLNSRIQTVLLRDATLDAGPWPAGRLIGPWRRSTRDVVTLARIGEGELDLRRTIDRLRGIGFAGPVVVAYPSTVPEAVGPVDALLEHAVQRWTSWKPAPPKAAAAKAAAPKAAPAKVPPKAPAASA